MKSKLSYKGITSTPMYSVEDHVIYGKLDLEDDLFLWESDTVNGVEAAFKEVVELYLEDCKESGTMPKTKYLALA